MGEQRKEEAHSVTKFAVKNLVILLVNEAEFPLVLETELVLSEVRGGMGQRRPRTNTSSLWSRSSLRWWLFSRAMR